MAYSGFKGIGPNGLGGSKKSVISPAKQMGTDAGRNSSVRRKQTIRVSGRRENGAS